MQSAWQKQKRSFEQIIPSYHLKAQRDFKGHLIALLVLDFTFLPFTKLTTSLWSNIAYDQVCVNYRHVSTYCKNVSYFQILNFINLGFHFFCKLLVLDHPFGPTKNKLHPTFTWQPCRCLETALICTLRVLLRVTFLPVWDFLNP